MDLSTDSEKQNHDEDVTEPINAAEPTELQARESLNRNNWDRNAEYDEFDGTPEPSAPQNDEAAGGNKDAAESKSSTSHLTGHTGGRTLGGARISDTEGSSSRSQPHQQAQGNAGKLFTINDLKKDENDVEENNADLDVVGGEKSALVVQGPEDARNRNRAKAEGIVNSAQRKAEAAAAAGSSPSGHFYGAGRKLGRDDAESRIIPATQGTPVPRFSDQRILNRQVPHTLHLWEDGFSINEDPLIKYERDVSTYLDEIAKGKVPEDIRKRMGIRPNEEVDVTVQQHAQQKWRQLPYVYRPWMDEGNRLGGLVPGISSSSFHATVATGATARRAEVDESQPIVTIRIQLPDGKRVPARFNTTHTVADIYAFVQQLNLDNLPRNWVLATTFPNKEHVDRSAVLGEMDEFKRGGVAVVRRV
ncbi:hypothetical protein MAPG_04044 [Magnaporthiopsis poae ATCC 64411]|uniref:UBX domain-containing protein n=1 Tax=Magnaporthiopsis poae (strain ATCC 64411 / 73-15) TaxID=644358 RepID=A0A0C4DVN5_MAGP6|nr:hypothetical protein MAPG_04044 [Magnaporthiopsis poae ATCC 64411]